MHLVGNSDQGQEKYIENHADDKLEFFSRDDDCVVEVFIYEIHNVKGRHVKTGNQSSNFLFHYSKEVGIGHPVESKVTWIELM